MATINYNGMIIQSIDECKVFEKPIKMLVWDECFERPTEQMVCAIIPYRSRGGAITTEGVFEYCSFIPEKFKQRRATHRELAMWVAQGRGEFKISVSNEARCYNYNAYSLKEENEQVSELYSARKWEDTDWHEPTIDYLGIGEEDENSRKD